MWVIFLFDIFTLCIVQLSFAVGHSCCFPRLFLLFLPHLSFIVAHFCIFHHVDHVQCVAFISIITGMSHFGYFWLVYHSI